MLADDLRKALANVWILVSVGALLALAAPFLLPADLILRLAPTCLSRAQFGVECPSCGMTRAFLAIAGGDLAEASALNRGSPWLYGACVLNTVLLAVWLGRLVARHRPGFDARAARLRRPGGRSPLRPRPALTPEDSHAGA
jgi:hypothetical protein